MRRGDRFPDDQAEVVFADAFVDQLADLTDVERHDVLGDVVRLCSEPAGTHPLATPLAGWNTLEVLNNNKRVVYKATVVEGSGLIEVLCLGPRSNNEVYDMAVGLDGWDFQPPPAPDGMIRAAVAAGLIDEPVVALLSKPELEAAMAEGWGAGARTRTQRWWPPWRRRAFATGCPPGPHRAR